MMLFLWLFACQTLTESEPFDSDTSAVDSTDTAVSQFDTDEPSTGDCHYSSRLGVCWQPLQSEVPSWTETVTPLLDTGYCTPFLECESASAARFALVDHHGEYADFQYWGPDGVFVAAVYNTDTVESDDPCDCLRAGISSWHGYPVSDCGNFNHAAVLLPGCPLERTLQPAGGLPESGLLTGLSTWEQTASFRNSTCAAVGSCDDGHTAVLRQTTDSDWGYSVNGGGVDVFDADGELVGTAEFATGASYGVVSQSCLAVANATQGCGLVLDE